MTATNTKMDELQLSPISVAMDDMLQLSPDTRHDRSFACMPPLEMEELDLGLAASIKLKSRFAQRTLSQEGEHQVAANKKRQRAAYEPIKRNQKHRFDSLIAAEPLQPTVEESVDLLPDGVIQVTLKLLGPHETATAAEVCQSWAGMSEDEMLWHDWCKERDFDLDPKGGTWRAYFAEQEQERLAGLCAFRKQHASTTSMSCPHYNTSLDTLQKLATHRDLLLICREGRGCGVLQLLALHALVLRRERTPDSNIRDAIRDLLRQLPEKRDTCIDIEWWQLGERDFAAGIRAPDHHVMHSTSFEGFCQLLASQLDESYTTAESSTSAPDNTGGPSRCLSLLNDRTFLGNHGLSAVTVVNWMAEDGRPSWQAELLATADERYRSWYHSGMRLVGD